MKPCDEHMRRLIHVKLRKWLLRVCKRAYTIGKVVTTDVWGIFCVMNRRRRGHIIMVYWFLSRCSWSWGMSKKTDLISLVHLRQMKWYLFCIVTSEWETFQFAQKCRFRPCVSRWRSLSRWWSSDAVVTVRWPRVLGMPILQCVIMGWWYGEAKW